MLTPCCITDDGRKAHGLTTNLCPWPMDSDYQNGRIQKHEEVIWFDDSGQIQEGYVLSSGKSTIKVKRWK